MTISSRRSKEERNMPGPRDYMRSTPVFKFPPIPTNKYVSVYKDENDRLFAIQDVEFVAVCEWESNKELFEGLCFLIYADNYSYFEIVSPDNMREGNRVAILPKDVTEWSLTGDDAKPVFLWDPDLCDYVHPKFGSISEPKSEA